jgi:hypothetical protein
MDKLEEIKRQSERSHRRDAEDQTLVMYQRFNALPERLHELRAYKDLIQLTRKYIPEKRLVDLPEKKENVEEWIDEIWMNSVQLYAIQRVLYELRENAWSDERCDDYFTIIDRNQLTPDDEATIDDTYYLLMEQLRRLPEFEKLYDHITLTESHLRYNRTTYDLKVYIIQKVSEKVSNILSHVQVIDIDAYLNWISEFKRLLPTLHSDVLDMTVDELDRINRELKDMLNELQYEIDRN